MLEIEKSLEKFYILAPEVYLTVDSDEIGNRMEKLNKQYNVSLGALIIFVTVSDMEKKNMAGYLKDEFKIGDIMAKKIIADLNKQIFDPLENRLSFLNNDPRKSKKQNEEDKNILRNIFQKKILREIKYHPVIINAVNLRIFYHFSHDLKFRKELEKILFTNNEKLTNKKFILKKKQATPTISNWIYYFIEVHGSEMFDNITLSKFLIDADNARLLTKTEKENLNKVLILYMNLKFFPNSMPNDDGDGWEIIPSGKREDKEKDKVELPEQVSKEEKETIIKEKEDEKAYEHKLAELELLLGKYPDDSLERKVIEEEIQKVRSKK